MIVGMTLPDLQLTASPGKPFRLHELGPGWIVIYLYDGSPEHIGRDAAEHRAFSCLERDFSERGVNVAGLSAETPQEQEATVARERICHVMLADPRLELATALGIPLHTDEYGSRYPRVTIIARHHTVAAALRVTSSERAADQVIAWMKLSGAA
jgi:peroxiredoxin